MIRLSFDIPWSLCPVVAMLQLTGNCVTLTLPSLMRIPVWCDVRGKSIVAVTFSGELKCFACTPWCIRIMFKLNKFFILYWNCVDFVVVPIFPCWPCSALELDPFASALCFIAHLLFTQMFICVDHVMWSSVATHDRWHFAPPPCPSLSCFMSLSPSLLCAMSWITFEAWPFSLFIKHSINKTLSGGRSLLSMLGWFCVISFFHVINSTAFLSVFLTHAVVVSRARLLLSDASR